MREVIKQRNWKEEDEPMPIAAKTIEHYAEQADRHPASARRRELLPQRLAKKYSLRTGPQTRRVNDIPFDVLSPVMVVANVGT